MQQSCCRRAPRVTQSYIHTSAHNYPRSRTIFSTCRHISGGSCPAPAPQTVTLYRSSTGAMTSLHSVCSLPRSFPPSPRLCSFSHTSKSERPEICYRSLTQQSMLNAFIPTHGRRGADTGHGCRRTQNRKTNKHKETGL